MREVGPAVPLGCPTEKVESMQNEFVYVVSSRPTLCKIETTPQIGYALGKVRDNAILRKGYMTNTMRIGHRGRSTS